MTQSTEQESIHTMIQSILDAIPYVAYLVDTDSFKVLAANRVLTNRHLDADPSAPCYVAYKGRISPCEDCPVLLQREDKHEADESASAINSIEQRWFKSSSAIGLMPDGRSVCFIMAIPTAEQNVVCETLDDFGYTDICTGIANNLRYEDTGPSLLRSCMEHGVGAAVLAMKVEGLHRINNTQGYAKGDDVLRTIARSLQSVLPADALFARRRGNDFSIIYPLRWLDARGELMELILRVERAITAACSTTPHDWIKTRFGISMAPDQGISFELLNRKARQAVAIGEQGSGQFSCQLYDDELMRQRNEREELTLDLGVAVRRGEMALVFQPKYAITTNCIVGAEALIRWNHPARGLVGPDVFIPLAEENLTIPIIDNWVITEVCRLWRQYMDAELPVVPVSINVSPQRFYQPDFINMLCQTLKDYELSPSIMEVELTERTALQDIGKAVEIMERLRKKGFRVAIDDFGTGYSSLNYLRSLPFDTVKLDRSFIAEPADNLYDILKNIVSMVKIYNAEVVFEGVETAEQFQLAKEVGCDLIQGYFTGRPMHPEKLISFLQQNPAALVNPIAPKALAPAPPESMDLH